MLDPELISKVLQIKEIKNYTLFDLSKKLGVQVTTIERWLKTKRINKIYADFVRAKLGID